MGLTADRILLTSDWVSCLNYSDGGPEDSQVASSSFNVSTLIGKSRWSCKPFAVKKLAKASHLIANSLKFWEALNRDLRDLITVNS